MKKMYHNFLKHFRFAVLVFIALTLANCSDSGSNDDDNGETIVENEYNVQRSKIVAVTAHNGLSTEAKFTWSVTKGPSDNYAFSDVTAKETLFAATEVGVYELTLLINDQGMMQTQKVKVNVTKETKEYKTFIDKVFEFKPAPGQFINDLPAANDGETAERILARANTYLAKKNGDLISLGAFGGYIVFGFDHTVVNIKGKRDFRVLGNAFWADANPNPDTSMRGGSSEAGVIMVSYDKNKNGLPDDEW